MLEAKSLLTAKLASKDAVFWLTQCTRTKDEQDLENPYKPFPEFPFLRPLFAMLDNEPVAWIEKSRTVMCSWAVSGWAAHKVFTRPAVRVVIQSEDEDRAVHDIEYAKVLWENSDPALKEQWPLEKPLEKQPYNELRLANGSSMVAIPGDPGKIRSEHPTIVVLDEAAHITEGEQSYNTASATRCPHLVSLSSAWPGWFRDVTEFSVPFVWPEYAGVPAEGIKGFSLRRTEAGHPVIRMHYSALPYATPEWVAAQRLRFTSQAYWNLEMEIQYEALSGQRVYPEFDPAVHVIPDELVPKRGCRYMSIDPHPRTPHAFLWVLIDQYSDWYVYRELWPSAVYGQPRNLRDDEEDNSFTIREYAETVAVLEGNSIEWRHPETDDEYGVYARAQYGGERIVDRFMDQAAKGFYAGTDSRSEETYSRRYDRFGLQCRDPYKSHKSGEDAIHSLLKLRRHDTRGFWPRLHIAASCRELIVELQKYRFKQSRSSPEARELKQEGVEARSHQIDNLRYLATSGIAYIPSLVS